MSMARITGLYIYPVKSCRGISLQELELTSTGPKFDRQWMLVDEQNQFLTLRTISKMAEIKTAIQGHFLHLYAGSNKILVDFSQDCATMEDVVVWDETVKAGIENKSINEALSDFLSKSVKLVRYQSQSFRDLEEAGTTAVKQVMFADARPLLLTNEASLADLNKKLAAKSKDPSHMERFRSNIIIEGLPAYLEDEIKEFKVQTESGEIILTNNKVCARCPIITQDVETGKVVSKETLQTLAEYRKKEGSNKVPFGVNLTPAKLGTLKVGQNIYY
jgi:uncharacterized protein